MNFASSLYLSKYFFFKFSHVYSKKEKLNLSCCIFFHGISVLTAHYVCANGELLKNVYFCFTCSFWNFDALFQPQQHPARDSHDTFFLQGLFNVVAFIMSTSVSSCQLIVVLCFFFCSSFNHQGTAWRLRSAGEADSWVWWLSIPRVWHLNFL